MNCPQKFPHRKNADGTYDSICIACFVTVARVKAEIDLRQFESAHICEPVNLCSVRQGLGNGSWGELG
jgi:hypothetical protein